MAITKLIFFFTILFVIFINEIKSDSTGKVVCYYNSQAVLREGLGKFTTFDLEQAIPFCTHVVYANAAGINADTNKITFSEEIKDDRRFAEFKRKNPSVKFLLSVGGTSDIENKEKYLSLLESSVGRISFINSAYTVVKNNGFDGLDLSWNFPENKPKKIRGSIKGFFHKIKEAVGISSDPVDPNLAEHTEQYTTVIRELRNAFRHDNFMLTATVLPNVNSSYFDVQAVINNLDFVVLAAFDFQTPERNRKEADYPAPLHELNERLPESNVNAIVQYWLGKRAPASKLILGTPTFSRAWKLEADSTQTGVPPIPELKEAAPEGPFTKKPGFLSWPEVCTKLPNPNNLNLKGENAPLTRVNDPAKKKGSYAYRLPDENGEHGIWIAYEDPDSAVNKATYVQTKGLGGMAVFDITTDDFKGTCAGEKFPILRAIKYRF